MKDAVQIELSFYFAPKSQAKKEFFGHRLEAESKKNQVHSSEQVYCSSVLQAITGTVNNNDTSNSTNGESTQQRRQHPRIRPSMPIPVRLPDGTVRNDLVLDISRGGLKVQCAREVAVIIHPGERRLVPENPQIIELQFGFPVGGKEELVTVTCRICHIKGMVDGSIDIGMQYVEFKGDSFDHFQRFLEESLIPV